MAGITNTFPPALQDILRDMCERVGADYESIDFSKEGWFQEYTWSIQDQEMFKKELLEKVRNNRDYYKPVFKSISLKTLEKEVDLFLMQYGWKYNEESQIN